MSSALNDEAAKTSVLPLQVYVVGAGSNLGDRRATLEAAWRRLQELNVEVLQVARLVKSEAWVLPGDPPGPEFLNTAYRVRWQGLNFELLAILQQVEREFGRVRERKWGARTLDLDILFGPESDDPALLIPHPAVWQRPFAIFPALEVAPELRTVSVAKLDELEAPIFADDSL